MGKKHVKTDLDRARDELFSHIQRCDVLEAAEEDQEGWMEETLEFMFERYPQLSPVDRIELGVLGRRYLKPIVPHGKESTAKNRSEWEDDEDAHAPDDAPTPEAAEEEPEGKEEVAAA